jgi:hypothetical protein
MNPIFDDNKDCDFAKYFAQLGYTYSWDMSRRDRLHWHELYGADRTLVLQVDMNVPLDQFIKDVIDDTIRQPTYFIASSESQWEPFRQKLKAFVTKIASMADLSKFKTGHQIARELLALPDLPVTFPIVNEDQKGYTAYPARLIQTELEGHDLINIMPDADAMVSMAEGPKTY